MPGAITLLLVFQLAGEVLAQRFALPLPGPVIGLAMGLNGLATASLVPLVMPWLQHGMVSPWR